jgi:hypothetical protein
VKVATVQVGGRPVPVSQDMALDLVTDLLRGRACLVHASEHPGHVWLAFRDGEVDGRPRVRKAELTDAQALETIRRVQREADARG